MNLKKYIERFKKDESFRLKFGLYYGATINLFFVAMQLYGGIKYQSVWFTALAVYYGVLSGVKYYLGHSVGKKGKEAWVSFQIAGFVMALLNLALVVMISIMIADPSIAIHRYSMLIAIVTAVWTLASAIVTMVGWARLRGKNAPVELAAKLVDVITAIVAVLMLQTSMVASISTLQIEKGVSLIEEFGSVTRVPEGIVEGISEVFQTLATSNSITGGVVAVFATGVTIYMIVRGTVEGKKYREKNLAKK